MKTWIGTSGFQYPEWKGKFFPAEISTAKMLPFYATRFTSTESNYTFRHLPSEKTIANWAKQTPEEFRWSFKAPQRITHFSKLKECAEILGVFHTAVARIGGRMGAVLFQLPASFKKEAERLKGFLADVPKGLRTAWEFRHPSWFDEEVYGILRDANSALCLAESEDLATPREVTADFGYLRLRRLDYTPAELEDWANFLAQQEDQWSDAFVYFKHEETGAGAEFGLRFLQMVFTPARFPHAPQTSSL